MQTLDKTLEELGLNPLMYGYEIDELIDTPAEQIEAYQRQTAEREAAICTWLDR